MFFLVLFAAALHAGWNAIVKGASDTFVSAVSICLAAAIVAALALPFVAQPARASWPYLGASMMLQTIYYSLVAATYKRADMSLAYPVMRGTAPHDRFMPRSISGTYSVASRAAIRLAGCLHPPRRFLVRPRVKAQAGYSPMNSSAALYA